MSKRKKQNKWSPLYVEAYTTVVLLKRKAAKLRVRAEEEALALEARARRLEQAMELDTRQ